MCANRGIRRHAARFTSLCTVALLLSQSLVVAAQEQSASPAPVAQQTPAQPTAEPVESSSAAGHTLAANVLPDAPQPQSQEQQQPAPPPQQPVGTAAAPLEKPTGTPGSRPSGAAIAPAKQRRVRAIVISLGVVLAAGVAVGTVAGMSRASHSTP